MHKRVVEQGDDGKGKMKNIMSVVCVCVCKIVYSLWTKNSVSLLKKEVEIIWFLKIC